MAPYRFALDFPQSSVIGASPELLVSVTGQEVTTRPISGSIRRQGQGGTLKAEEVRLLQELMGSEKEKSELDMLVDLARHDLHRVCDDVRVESYREALVLETVVHTQATVRGKLKPHRDALDAFFSCLNAGTLVGAPKKKAMEILASLEGKPRGYYGGNLIHVLPDGDLRATILIRTAILRGNTLSIQAGASVLLGSNVDYEFWECGAKARSLLAEIGHEHLCFNEAPPPPVAAPNTLTLPFAGELSPFPKREGQGAHLLLIDNQDSFTFNLAALFESQGCTLSVVRNDAPFPDLSGFDGVLLSPGPSTHRDAGFLIDVVKVCSGKIPVFGVCLGMQAMVEALGGELGRMKSPLHGKRRSVIYRGESRFWKGLDRNFMAARYHSLHAVNVLAPLQVVATDEDGVVLAVEGPQDWPPFLGVQFHPESFLTGRAGVLLAENWLGALRSRSALD